MTETGEFEPRPLSHLERFQARQRAQKDRARLRDVELNRAIEERDRRIYEQKRKDDQRRNSANYRARKRERDRSSMAVSTLLDALGPVPRVALAKDMLLNEARLFSEWLDLGGTVQRQLAGRRRELMRSRVALLQARGELGSDPGYGHFAHYLSRIVGGEWSKEAARTRLNAIRRLEGPEGPWTETYP
ncbi:hypothetical protein ACFSCV_07900 [Methylopila henanensis]|uniref:Uncharacterized protein n=1 Tax=Methylopila henanensis TaxID=873516 RepID=A0ABW4K8D2_9HYPH